MSQLLPGHHVYVASNGMKLHLGYEVDQDMVNRVADVIARAGLTPDDVAGVEFVGEQTRLDVVELVEGRVRHRTVVV